jgi:hypothetical protein
MRVLLTDGSGLTARQSANRLAAEGHVVEALAPDPLCLCRFTRHVARIHRVPVYGSDPLGWLEAALDIFRSGQFDVLLPTQEQVAVLSLARERMRASGVATVVPPFASLASLQDKVSAFATLRRLNLPQPLTATDAEGWTTFPAFVKEPIGTASGGVRRVTTTAELRDAAANGPVLIQAAVAGPLAMCQAVFGHGSLVAFHANVRTGEGANGGASHKCSIELPDVRNWFEILGAELAWHGALSADVILGDDGPTFIDVNPRLVEPENAWRSGVDLVGSMMELAIGWNPAKQLPSRPGVVTHQLLLAVLGAAQQGRGRRGIITELLEASLKSGPYRDSIEELTPKARDPKAIVPVVMAAASTLVRPRSWSWFASGSVTNYALSDAGWQQILEEGARLGPGRRCVGLARARTVNIATLAK